MATTLTTRRGACDLYFKRLKEYNPELYTDKALLEHILDSKQSAFEALRDLVSREYQQKGFTTDLFDRVKHVRKVGDLTAQLAREILFSTATSCGKKEDRKAVAFSVLYASPQLAKVIKIENRTQAGGFFNLGSTCWFNSLLQQFFRPEGHFRASLRALSNEAFLNSDDVEIQQWAQRARNLLDILILADAEPTIDLNRELYERIEGFMDDFFKKSLYLEGDPCVRQQDPEEGFNALIGYLGLDEMKAPDCVKACLPQIAHGNFRRGLEIAPYERRTKVERVHMPVLRHNEGKKRSMRELFESATLVSELLTGDERVYFDRPKEQVEEALKVDYFTRGSDQIPDQLTFAAPRFDKITRGKDETPLVFDRQTTLNLYNEDGTEVDTKLTLELQSIVCHIGKNNGGHYVTAVSNGDGSFTIYNDDQTQNLAADRAQKYLEDTGYLVRYRVIKKERPTREEKADFNTTTMIYERFRHERIQDGTRRAERTAFLRKTAYTAAFLLGSAAVGTMGVLATMYESYNDMMTQWGFREEPPPAPDPTFWESLFGS